MIQDTIFIWKLLSLLFFSGLILFLLYSLIKQLLTKLEFKKRLNLVKNELLFDILKDNDSNLSKEFALDDLSEVDIESRMELSDLKKKIFCDIYKLDLKDLEQDINNVTSEKEKKLNQIILNKYRDAIKSLNEKVVFLKSELNIFRLSMSPFIDKFNKEKNMKLTDKIKNELEEFLRERSKDIISESLECKNTDLESRVLSLMTENSNLYEYISMLQKQNNSQKNKNIMFAFAIIILFAFLFLFFVFQILPSMW